MKLVASLLLMAVSLVPILAQARPAPDCAKFENVKIAAMSIGLPTKGAMVTATHTVVAGGTGGGTYGQAGAHGEYCLVTGKILSLDPAAQNINFQIALPAHWNQKALMLGGGGFDGVVPAVAGNLLNAPADSPTPLARGYAVFGSDSGHQAPASGAPMMVGHEEGVFFENPEEYRNYIGDALKKTRDVAMLIIRTAYARAPRKSYFFGGSKGGGEAITVAGRWPSDWDGIVALYPARNFTVSMLGSLAVTQALSVPSAYLNMAKRAVLHRAVLAACDGLDGVKDGLISNVARCNAVFDPSTAMLDSVPVRCPGGADTGDTCLSDAQIDALRKASGPLVFHYPIAGGQKSFPGFNIMTSDLGGSTSSPLDALVARLTIGTSQPTFPTSNGNSMAADFSENFMRFAVANDANFNQLTFDLSDPGPLASRLGDLSSLDHGDVDLAPFARRKGKLLIMHGTDDMLVSPRATELYYRQLQEAMGADKVATFLRFYEVPGFGHSLSTTFHASWDQLTALEGWVERGVDPSNNQIVTDTTGVPGRTRPLCLYPSWPKYRGSGDVNIAGSFACSVR